MKSKRDNFTPKTIETLKLRVAGRCSNPDCRVQTLSAKTENNEGVTNIGKAAHICAASPGGPRYNSNMSAKERKSIDNGIWLCSNHADEIDKDIKAYPVKLLKKWKKIAEEKSRLEIGTKIPDADETINTLTTMLTGNLPPITPQDAVKNVMSASKKSFENLDPRFSVQASYINECTVFEFHAKEKINASISIKTEDKRKFREAYKDLWDNAQKFKIQCDNAHISGSPIFDKIFKNVEVSSVEISPYPLDAEVLLKISIKNKKNMYPYKLDDIKGQIIVGRKSFVFEGSTFCNLLKVKINKGLDASKAGKITIDYDFQLWEHKNVKELPYFKKSYEFISAVVEDGEFQLSLEINGEELLSSKHLDTYSTFLPLYHFHRLILFCRTISEKFGCDIYFKSNSIHSKEEYEQLELYYKIIKHNNRFDYNEDDYASSVTLQVTEENYDKLSNLNELEPMVISLNDTKKSTVSLFGATYNFPEIVHVLTKVRMSLNLKELIIGESVKIILYPVNGCEYYLELQE